MSSPSSSPEPAPHSTIDPTMMSVSVKDRARNWQQATPSSSSSSSSSSPAAEAADETLTTGSESELPPPPTIEEIEAMEKEAAAAAAADADSKPSEEEDVEVCHTPSGSSLSASASKQYSRQVSRVSGTGRTVRASTPRATAAAAAEKAAAAAAIAEEAAAGPQRRGRSPTQTTQKIQHDFGSRRSISVDDPDRRPRQQRSVRGLAPNNGAPPARRPVANKPATGNSSSNSSRVTQNSGGRMPKPAPPSRRVQQPRPLANGGGRGGRVPYTAHGTPSVAATSNRARQQQQQQQQQQCPQSATSSAFGGSRNFDIRISPPGMAEVAPKLRRHNSAPDMGMMDGEGHGDESLPFRNDTRQAPGMSPAQDCWGGGLPPTCGPAAARAAVAANAAASAAPARAAGSTAGSSRYPATDRESFARTLNEEELDEVWKGLGEGVSQRGCGSEVAFDPADNAAVPGSPSGTAVSGAFPMLTANVLERHDQLADGGGSGGSSSGGARHASVVPVPKQIGDRAVEDMENGTRSSSKKSKGSNRGNNAPHQQQQTTLLGAIVSTVILGLWMAHLVFNVLLLWPIVADHHVWAVCFVPGVLGILLSFNSCRKSHRHCKPVADEEEAERPRRSGPHPCALPAYTVVLLSVVACLGMHAAAMLFCQKDMMLVFDEETLDPLCDRSLTVPVILDGVLLTVASLKASSLCWAWVLS